MSTQRRGSSSGRGGRRGGSRGGSSRGRGGGSRTGRGGRGGGRSRGGGRGRGRGGGRGRGRGRKAGGRGGRRRGPPKCFTTSPIGFVNFGCKQCGDFFNEVMLANHLYEKRHLKGIKYLPTDKMVECENCHTSQLFDLIGFANAGRISRILCEKCSLTDPGVYPERLTFNNVDSLRKLVQYLDPASAGKETKIDFATLSSAFVDDNSEDEGEYDDEDGGYDEEEGEYYGEEDGDGDYDDDYDEEYGEEGEFDEEEEDYLYEESDPVTKDSELVTKMKDLSTSVVPNNTSKSNSDVKPDLKEKEKKNNKKNGKETPQKDTKSIPEKVSSKDSSKDTKQIEAQNFKAKDAKSKKNATSKDDKPKADQFNIDNSKSSKSKSDAKKDSKSNQKSTQNSNSKISKADPKSDISKSTKQKNEKKEKQPDNSKNNKSTDKDSKNIKNKKLTKEEEEAAKLEEVTVSRIKRVDNLIASTTPKITPLKYDSLEDYYEHITYGLFLEELYENDFIQEVTINQTSQKEYTAVFDHNEIMKILPDNLKRFRTSPFPRNSVFILTSKADTKLISKPILYFGYIENSYIDRGRRATLNVEVILFDWNKNKLPAVIRKNDYAIMACSTPVSRILKSSLTLDNPAFKSLILGQDPIKQINYASGKSVAGLSLNQSQKSALQSVLINHTTVLQGPPGTGKTSTIYEIVKQLSSQLNYHPIVVVAASNVAIDNIAEKFVKDGRKDILRIVSLSKESEYGEDTHPLGPYCIHNKLEKTFNLQQKEIRSNMRRSRHDLVSKNGYRKYMDAMTSNAAQLVHQAKIIFSTTITLAGPVMQALTTVPVVVLDEATQSSEPSCLIPLTMKGIRKIVLVGDDKQLSAFARVPSLQMSLFERVLRNGTYKNPFMLDTQYRMHPAISKFSRNTFYDGKLLDGITESDRSKYNIKSPIYFWDTSNLNLKESKFFRLSSEEKGYSYRNRGEAERVLQVLTTLIVEKNVKPEDIGIVTPYGSQRDLISSMIQKDIVLNPKKTDIKIDIDRDDIDTESKHGVGMNVHIVNNMLIASIDAFQGHERDFIVMSLVRSNELNNIGFVKDERRMNVALTRAKYGLIIIGNSKCLSNGDKLWKKYIDELQESKFVYKGNEFNY